MEGSDGEQPERFDVLRYHDGECRAVPAGDGRAVVAAHENEARSRRLTAMLLVAILLPIGGAVFGVAYLDAVVVPAVAGLAVGLVLAAVRYRTDSGDELVPEVVAADASERIVREHVDEFDPDEVSDPFE